MNSDTPINKILILAANPKQTTRLRLDEEMRDIQEGLRLSQQRDQFILQHELAVRPRDFRRSVLNFRPNIIHFSGHGTGITGLSFEDEIGKEKLVTGVALAGLFAQFAKQVECVLLNACYSEEQAVAIAQHIDYVIGMNAPIGDKAALEFAVGFYDALAAYNPQYDEGSPIEFAFNIACNAIQFAGVAGESIPVLKKNPHLSETQEINRKPLNDSKVSFGTATVNSNQVLPNPQKQDEYRQVVNDTGDTETPALRNTENIKLLNTISNYVGLRRSTKPLIGAGIATVVALTSYILVISPPKFRESSATPTPSPTQTAPVSVSAKEFYDKGVGKFNKKDYKGAIADLSLVLSIDSTNAEAYFWRGRASYEDGDKEGAVTDYNQALKFAPNHADAYYWRGLAFGNQDKHKLALADFDERIRLKPDDTYAYYLRGIAHSKLKDNKAAIEDFTQAIARDPKYADYYFRRGSARDDEGDKQGAIEDYTQVIERDRKNSNAYYSRGIAFGNQDKHKEALADFDELIRLKPDYAYGYYLKGIAHSKLKDNKAAIEDFTQAIERDPKYADYYFKRGNARNELGNKQEAITDYQKAADLYRQQNKPKESQEALEKIKQLKQ
jgi:tetratricopeptide (TPR) repeat protein